jgi:hypothetical protein
MLLSLDAIRRCARVLKSHQLPMTATIPLTFLGRKPYRCPRLTLFLECLCVPLRTSGTPR